MSERDDFRPRETKVRARVASIRITVRLVFLFVARPCPRYAAARNSGRTKGKTVIASVIPHTLALAFSLAAETACRRFRDRTEIAGGKKRTKKESGGERGLEERAHHTPPRSGQTWYPRSGHHRAPITALRPIDEPVAGGKTQFPKGVRPPLRQPASPSRRDHVVPQDDPCAGFFGRSREPPEDPSLLSRSRRRSTTMIGRALSRSAAAVSDRPARAAFTWRTLHNSSRATSPSKTA